MKIYLLIFLLIFVSSVRASDDLIERADNISEGIREKYSINGDIEIFDGKVEMGAAEAKRYPLKGNMIILDSDRIDDINDFQLIGLMAHEMAHLEYYSEMNWLQLAVFALKYALSGSYATSIERETDMKAIEKGYGKELLGYREYRISHSFGDELEFLQENYLSSDEIKDLIKFIN